MSSNPWRDHYLSIEAEPDKERPLAAKAEVNAAVILARACVLGGFTSAAIVGALVYVWVR